MAGRAPSNARRCRPEPNEGEEAIGPELRSLVQTYVAYLSGCDACAIASRQAALATADDPSRLDLLSTWRRAPARTYTERERIALVLAEVAAVSGREGIGEDLRRQAAELFDAEEMDALLRTMTATRGYKRLMLQRTGESFPSRRRRGRPADPCRDQGS